ncbi:MAG: zinc ABC transporter substrate-binding protein [Crenarchaeota archaeon]|nr:zinc ABC transporter substrate-binding protein [Thermoproteota archaeon]
MGDIRLSTFILVILVCLIPCYGFVHTDQSNSKPLVVATTSVISSIVKDLASDALNVVYIVPPSLCPGHYDIRPGDVELVRSANLILKHGIAGEFWLDTLISKANESGDLHVPVVSIGGSWNTPTAARALYENVALAIQDHLGIDVSQRLNSCLQAINNTEAELMKLASENQFMGVPVVAMLWQKPFVEFLGFKVVATYGPPEKLSESDIAKIIENATRENAKLVIDNVHSGVSVGEKIATHVGAVHVALINFPEILPEANNLTTMMIYNARLLANAINEYEYRLEIQRLKATNDLLVQIAISIGLIAAVETSLILMIVMRRKRQT